jgi:hypothetical protein
MEMAPTFEGRSAREIYDCWRQRLSEAFGRIGRALGETGQKRVIDITNFIFETSGLFTEIVFLDMLEFGIRAEYIEVLITRKYPEKRSRTF